MWKHLKCQMVLVAKNSPASAEDVRDMGLIPESGRSPGGGRGNPLQYSSLENPMDRGAWWLTVHRVTKSRTWLKWLSTHALNYVNIFFVGLLLSNQINSTKAKVVKRELSVLHLLSVFYQSYFKGWSVPRSIVSNFNSFIHCSVAKKIYNEKCYSYNNSNIKIPRAEKY